MAENILKGFLEAYKTGKISETEAEEKILRLFYEEGEFFLLDIHREKRIGFPEIIFAEGKETGHLLAIIEKVLTKKDVVFVSQIDTEKEKKIRKNFPKNTIKKAGKLLVIKKKKNRNKN